jgi:hypothetical protein
VVGSDDGLGRTRRLWSLRQRAAAVGHDRAGDLTGVSGIERCTIPYPGSTTRFRLYRLNATSLESCSSNAAATFMTDYIAPPSGGWPSNAATTPAPTDWAGNIWPTADTCTAGSLPTIAVDLNVSYDPVGHPKRHTTSRIGSRRSTPTPARRLSGRVRVKNVLLRTVLEHPKGGRACRLGCATVRSCRHTTSS